MLNLVHVKLYNAAVTIATDVLLGAEQSRDGWQSRRQMAYQDAQKTETYFA
jgi:hypothetical protein